MVNPFGITEWREDTYMTNRRDEMEEPCGTPTETGAKVRGEPRNVMRLIWFLRKEPIHRIS